ncbi:hypothetical protein GC176_24045 [bacterium]|nr:hypothetical protein [bacterium]
MKTQRTLQLISAALISVGLLGCADSGSDYQQVTPEAAKAAADSHDHDHAHAHGPNGGDLVELGDHSIHAEVVFDEGTGKLDVYLLGEDAKTAHPVALTDLTLSFAHGDESEDFTLAAAPLDGEPEGQSSRFSLTNSEIVEEFHEHSEGANLHFTLNGKDYKGAVHHHHDHADHDHADHAHADGHSDAVHADHDHAADDKKGAASSDGHKDEAARNDSAASAAETKGDEAAAATDKKQETEVVEE